MTQTFIATAKSKTIQAAQTITAAASGAITVTSTTGWEAGDIGLISGVGGATGVNGLCTVAIASGTSFTVKDMATGATKTFGGSYTSGGSIAHLGFQVAAVAVDNTVFTSTNPDFTLKTLVAKLSAATIARISVLDTADNFAADIKPGPVVFVAGQQDVGLATRSARRYDCPGLRLGNANNSLKINMYLEGLNGGAPTAGQTITWSTWLET